MSFLINWILVILCIFSTSKQEAEEEEEEEDWASDLLTSKHSYGPILKHLKQAHLPIMTLSNQVSLMFHCEWRPWM